MLSFDYISQNAYKLCQYKVIAIFLVKNEVFIQKYFCVNKTIQYENKTNMKDIEIYLILHLSSVKILK